MGGEGNEALWVWDERIGWVEWEKAGRTLTAHSTPGAMFVHGGSAGSATAAASNVASTEAGAWAGAGGALGKDWARKPRARADCA